MTTRTQAQLAERVMRKYNWVDALHSPSATDTAYVTSVYQNKLEEWRTDHDLVYWLADEIPLAVFETLADLIINQVWETYTGKDRSPVEIQASEVELLRPLRRHVQKRASGLPTATDYF